MSEVLRPTVQTPIASVDLALALLREEPAIQREGVAIVWGQYAIETGKGAHCYNFNLGNVKHVRGDGFGYIELHNVWEGVAPDMFGRLRAGLFGHLVRPDPSEEHQNAVHPNVAVVFDPPHPATQFRAYDSLDHAVWEHVRFLQTRYALAWNAIMEGDPRLFVHQLRAKGYFTASEESYLHGLLPFFDAFLKTSDFEHAIALYKDEIATAETPAIVYAMPEPLGSGGDSGVQGYRDTAEPPNPSTPEPQSESDEDP